MTRNKTMKKYILAIIMLMAVFVTASGQNYLNKTRVQIVKALEANAILYEEYYTKTGNLAISYETDLEKRIYVIGERGVCCFYIVYSNQDDFIFKMRTYAVDNGFVFKYKDENYTYYYKKQLQQITVGSNSTDDDVSQYWTYFFLYDSGLN